jgi:hypothetical protein
MTYCLEVAGEFAVLALAQALHLLSQGLPVDVLPLALPDQGSGG